MTYPSKRILVLGATGLLGNATLRLFADSPGFEAFGSIRSHAALHRLPPALHARVIEGVDVEDQDSLVSVLATVRPDVVINCVGVVKQLAAADDPLASIPINALLPHRLARLCQLAGARLVHMSTDCVFSGAKGMYIESDVSDARDLYGRSKYLGEVDYDNAVTLRTSIVGHELDGARSLISWFLAQSGNVKGFRRAIFSGLPTVEVARIIRDHVLPRPELRGVYHVSSEPISKFELLTLVAHAYQKDIEIVPEDAFLINRSLDSTRFRTAAGYTPRVWPELVGIMREFG